MDRAPRSVPIFERRIFTRKVIYRVFQLNVGTFQKCKNTHACALGDCLGVSRLISRPFVSDTSPKCIDREGLERRRTGTRLRTRQRLSYRVTSVSPIAYEALYEANGIFARRQGGWTFCFVSAFSLHQHKTNSFLAFKGVLPRRYHSTN